MARGTWISGVVLLAAAVLIPAVFFLAAGVQGDAGDGWDAFGNVVLGVIFLVIVSPILGLVGLILLIVGVATGGQQQQQQVVVYSGGGTGRVCPSCRSVVAQGHGFCTSCGSRMHG